MMEYMGVGRSLFLSQLFQSKNVQSLPSGSMCKFYRQSVAHSIQIQSRANNSLLTTVRYHFSIGYSVMHPKIIENDNRIF